MAEEFHDNRSGFVASFGALTPALFFPTPGIATSSSAKTFQGSGASGYKPYYQNNYPHDQGRNEDQAHHFAFHFQYGAGLGAFNPMAGLSVEFLQAIAEVARGRAPSSLFNFGDMLLGDVAAGLGRAVRVGAVSPSQVGSFVKATLCN
jgi:hypothetical protein